MLISDVDVRGGPPSAAAGREPAKASLRPAASRLASPSWLLLAICAPSFSASIDFQTSPAVPLPKKLCESLGSMVWMKLCSTKASSWEKASGGFAARVAATVEGGTVSWTGVSDDFVSVDVLVCQLDELLGAGADAAKSLPTSAPAR